MIINLSITIINFVIQGMELSAWLRTLGGDFRGCMIEDEFGKVLRPNHRLKNGEFITIKYPIDEDELP